MSVIFNLDDIKNAIPHREPFLFVESVIEYDPGKSIVAVQTFGPEEDFFRGHFPGNPIVPGVLIVEALAQASGVLIFHSFREEIDKNGHTGAYLAGLGNIRYRKIVVPGDEIKLNAWLERKRSNIYRFKTEATVGGERAAEASIMLSLY